LLLRFVAKSVQTKGIRFKCRLCGEMMATKAVSSLHFQSAAHAADLQAFKRQKNPKIFEAAKAAAKAEVPKISFARDAVLGKKRPVDEDASFGGWTKKEKPEPPPIMRPEYQQEAEPILQAPPWQNAQRPSNENASQMDKEVDGHIAQAQVKRFSKRNVLEVNPTTVRCKLCFKVIGTLPEAERHVVACHCEDFEKEMKIWERFCHTSAKRQPPFGWVCKICSTFFPSDADTWRHLGKEVYIRREERHLTQWHDKEDRWGHEDDQECCGDGMSVGGGLSFESVQRFQEASKREDAERDAKAMASNKGDESSEDEPVPVPEAEIGRVKMVTEF